MYCLFMNSADQIAAWLCCTQQSALNIDRAYSIVIIDRWSSCQGVWPEEYVEESKWNNQKHFEW